MSNNLVSEPISSMQMAQLEPLMSKVDSSGRQMEMGLLGPVFSDTVSQSQGTSNEHVGLLRDVPGEPRSQGLPLSSMQSGRVEAQANNPGMNQILSPNRQSMQLGTPPNRTGQQQQPTTAKRKAAMELSSSISFNKRVAQMGNRPWLQQVPNSSNKGSLQMQSSSNSPRTLHSAASSKRKTQLDNTSSKAGTPRSMNSKSQNMQTKQSSKVQTESCDSVRSKMRESLTAALALVSQQGKTQLPNNNTPNDATHIQGKLENSYQNTGSTRASIDASLEQRQDISQTVNSSFAEADSIGHVVGEHMHSTTFNGDFQEEFKDYEAGSTNASNNECILSSMHVLNCDKQDFQSGYTLTTDDVPFSDSFFMKDDLLQGNGLSWVLSDMVDVGNQRESQSNIELKSEPDVTGEGCREEVPVPALLATRIEAELFKLFGGVNKKYKEKGRSLLFNLKDRNNPELRERVMFGEIPPKQLCTMTAEGLASKELSQWRIAKAEELAQMVVLPDSDVDFRRLVKKTHKGEFQVEVEHEDNVSVEVSGGTTSGSRSQTMNKDVEGSSPSKPDVNNDAEKGNLQKVETFSITISSNDGTDPMQGLMTDDALKDPDFLPPIVSLDEFMESLHSEPPFENLPVESGKGTLNSDKDDSGIGSKSKSSDLTPKEQADGSTDKSDKFQSASVNSDAEKDKKYNAESGAISSNTRYSGSQAEMKTSDGHTKERSTEDGKSVSSDADLRGSLFHAEERYGNNNRHLKDAVPTKGECLWEGMLQPNISTTQSVISIFKSGEKIAAKDWPGFLEIKGRVRLDLFEKFLQDLQMSRSRAIMVSHFVSKEPDGQSTLREVADSYILDERVGFAEPVHGVELYFCPPHKKTVEMLSNILPKEQIEAINSIDNGLIGIVVWRKTNLTLSISPTTSSHHKHSSKRQHFRRQQDINVNANSTHKAVPSSTGLKTTENDDDDVPPGFGPPVTRVEDDLPEFNFSGGSNPTHLSQKPMRPPNMVPLHSVNPVPPRPVEQMRQLVHKYGQTKPNAPSVNWQDKFGGTIQPWNDDDDDIPEWQPQNSQNQFPPQNYQLRPHILNQSFPGSQQRPIMTPQYLQPQINVTHGQRNFDPQWVPSPQPQQRGGPPPYGTPAQGTTWPQHVSRNRGY